MSLSIPSFNSFSGPTDSAGERELLEELASLKDTSSNRSRTRAKPQQPSSKLSNL